jgi:predicted RNase H-like nuclease (RuvC/YqgF family)
MSDAAKQAQMSEQMAANASKGALIEKVVFAAIPILFSCVVYLMTSLSSANNEITILKSRIAVVVTQDNRAIPPQGTTIDMAQIREQLSNRIEQVERDAAIARGNMTLDRERSMAGIERGRLEMAADAAAARAAIRSDLTRMITELERRVALLESRNGSPAQSR